MVPDHSTALQKHVSQNECRMVLVSEAMAVGILCLHGGGLQQQLDHLEVAVPCCREQRRSASAQPRSQGDSV